VGKFFPRFAEVRAERFHALIRFVR